MRRAIVLIIFFSALFSSVFAYPIDDIAAQQVLAEQPMVSAFLDNISTMFSKDSQALLKKPYPYGHKDKQHPAYLSLPARYIDNIFSVSKNGRLQVIIRFNNSAYTAPVLHNAQVVMTAYNHNKPVTYNRIYHADARSISEWRCENTNASVFINQGPFARCGIYYY